MTYFQGVGGKWEGNLVKGLKNERKRKNLGTAWFQGFLWLREKDLNQRLAPCGARNFRAADGASTQNFDRCGNATHPSSAPGSGWAAFKLFARLFRKMRKSQANKTEGRWFKSIDTTKQKKSHTPNGVWDSFGCGRRTWTNSHLLAVARKNHRVRGGALDFFDRCACCRLAASPTGCASAAQQVIRSTFSQNAKSQANKTEGRWSKSIDTTKQKKSHTPNGVWDSFGLSFQKRCRRIFWKNGMK